MVEQRKSVLVTGGAGFIGTHLVRHLLDVGEKVVVLDAFTEAANREGAARASRRGAVIIEGDVCDTQALARAMMHGVGTVFHLAAETRVKTTFADPDRTLRVNGEGTERVLEAARSWDVERVVHLSSTAALPAKRPTPYGASKRHAEQACKAMRERGLDIRIVRAPNVVGRGESGETVLARFVAQALDGEPLTVEGKGTAVRGFLDVECLARALRLAMAVDRPGATLDVDTRHQCTIAALARRVAERLGRDVAIKRVRNRRAQNADPVLDGALLRDLGWRQRRTLDEMIEACAKERGWTPLARSLRNVLPKHLSRKAVRAEQVRGPVASWQGGRPPAASGRAAHRAAIGDA